MYLRTITSAATRHFVLRESFRHGDEWRHRDLLDLGSDPSTCIVYPGGNGFYFEPGFLDRLDETGASYSEEELEEAFFVFLPPRIQQLLRQFSRRSSHQRKVESVPDPRMAYLHSFDKRRLHYLRFGRMDMGVLDERALKYVHVLYDKSRDEIEHTIETMEQVLRPHEARNYLYAALNLELYFSGSLLRHHPLALDPEKVDQFFLDEICALNGDKLFFRGVERKDPAALHEHLTRYVIFYFDALPAARMDFMDFRQFFRGRRGGAYGGSTARGTSRKEALGRFGITQAEYETMSEEDLVKLYRRKAKDAHPDMGGDHDDFLELTEAYEALRRGL